MTPSRLFQLRQHRTRTKKTQLDDRRQFHLINRDYLSFIVKNSKPKFEFVNSKSLFLLSLFLRRLIFLQTEDISSAEHLLQKIVPLGSMPSMPDGFPSLSELKTDKFEYSTNKGKVTVTADLEDPVSLLGQAMTLNDVKMTFKYDKNRPEGKWQFNAEGKSPSTLC